MRYLLDTHACVWAISDPGKLSARVRDVLQTPGHQFCVSKISLLEIVIKKKTTRVEEFNVAFPEFFHSIQSSGFSLLPLKEEHIETYDLLQFHETHRDPFDRYLLATARSENLAIITKDEKFQLYADSFSIIW